MNGVGASASTRLIQVDQSGKNVLVKTQSTDSAGGFIYDSIPEGNYFVEAWQDGQISGKSSTFTLTDPISNLMIVLVKPVFITLDLRSLGQVDSAYLNYPENPCIRIDSIWSARGLVGDSGVLFTRILDSNGNPNWVSWKVRLEGGNLELIGFGGVATTPKTSIDSSAYFPSRHTVALWNFDTLQNGRIRDLSSYHNDLLAPSGSYLVTSPHNMALDLERQPASPKLRVGGDSLPASLRWQRTGQQTLTMRIKWDGTLPRLTTLIGNTDGFRIQLNSDRQVLILSKAQTSIGSWDWVTYMSAIQVVPTDHWVELMVARSKSDNAFYLWIDNQAMPLYLDADPVPRMPDEGSDTLCICHKTWDVEKTNVLIDEIEILDTISQPIKLAVHSLSPVIHPMNNAYIDVFGFNEGSNGSADASILRSDSIQIDSIRSMYVKLTNLSLIKDRSSPNALLSLFMVGGDCGGALEEFQIFVANASFEKKINQNLAPIQGVDFDATPLGTTLNVCSDSSQTTFSVTAPINQWAKDSTTNHGLVIRPSNKALPRRTLYTKYRQGIIANYLLVWLE